MTKIHIRFIDGVHVRIPVEALLVRDDVYQIMPDDEFEHEDDGTLFEFGALDLVKIKQVDTASGEIIPVASGLVREGEKGNLQKRLLFRMEADRPDPKILLKNVDPKEIVALLEKVDTARFVYPAIKDWLSIHRETIESSLK